MEELLPSIRMVLKTQSKSMRLKKRSQDMRAVTDLLDTISSSTGSIGGRMRKTGLVMFMLSTAKDDDTVSAIGKRKFVLHGELFPS